jgi:HPt (histidine-containing phosphotransfer) domain-containing protein
MSAEVPGSNPVDAINIDLARKVIGNDEAVLASVVNSLFKEYPLRISEIEKGLKDKDAKVVRRAAHTLKGAVNVFGAKPVMETAIRIEQLARAKDLAAIPELLELLKLQGTKMLEALQQFVGDNKET